MYHNFVESHEVRTQRARRSSYDQKGIAASRTNGAEDGREAKYVPSQRSHGNIRTEKWWLDLASLSELLLARVFLREGVGVKVGMK